MNFDDAFSRLINSEGGYTNNPADPGGETKFGISRRSYPNVDIANLTLEGAKEIYLRDFWNPIGDAHPSIKFQAFDFAVNSGIQTAIRKLQAAIGVADDGHWGPISQAAADKTSESDMIMLLLAERLDFMTRLKNWPDASRGWSRRIATNLRYGAQDS